MIPLIFAVALVVQLVRTHGGHLRIAHLLFVVIGVLVVVFGSLWMAELLLSTVALILTVVLSAGFERQLSPSRHRLKPVRFWPPS